ncbi:MAG: hypothetical protein WCK58_01265 [Chloroflexota bacterium]
MTADAGAVDASSALMLVESAGTGGIVERLAAVATIDSTFYALRASGDQDSLRRAQLRFPATSDASRVAAIVDGTYLFVYAVAPVGGVLAVDVKAPPAKPQAGDNPMTAAGDVQYFVLTPKGAAGLVRPAGAAVTAAWHPSSPALDGATPPRAVVAGEGNRPCLAGGEMPVELQTCRMNAKGSVQVSWSSYETIPTTSVDAVIAAVETAMTAYRDLGLDGAVIGANAPVRVIIREGDDTPTYKVAVSSVYIGSVTAGALGEADKALELKHELMHLVEDDGYAMIWGYWNADKHWWLEMAADVGTFFIDAAAEQRIASVYGRSSLNDMHTLIFQVSPFTWSNDEQYVQSLLVRANICDAGCPLTKASFVQAVNGGSYPYADSAKRAALRTNMDAWAQAILTGTIDGTTVAALASGTSTGDFLAVGVGKAGEVKFDTNSYPPQIAKDTGIITAVLKPDSVYPLLIASGATATEASGRDLGVGAPVMVRIAPGPEIYYQLDGGRITHADGTAELVLGPVQAGIGAPKLRIVAVAKAAEATFKATVEPADLQGDWLFTATSASGASVTGDPSCSESTSTDTGSGNTLSILNGLSQAAAGYGSYVATDPKSPGSLAWTLEKGQSMDKVGGEGGTYESTLVFGKDGALMHTVLVIPPPKATGDVAPPVGLLVMVPLAGGLVVRRRRRLGAILAMLLVGALVQGCMGVTIYGTITYDQTYTKLEYVARTGANTKPVWHLSGAKGPATADLTVIAVTTDESGKDTTETVHCVGTMAIVSGADSFKDGVIKPEK